MDRCERPGLSVGLRACDMRPSLHQLFREHGVGIQDQQRPGGAMTQFDYSGTELDVFRHAVNWKRYWAAAIAPFLGNDVLDVGAGIGATAVNLKQHACNRWVELEPDAQLSRRIEELR